MVLQYKKKKTAKKKSAVGRRKGSGVLTPKQKRALQIAVRAAALARKRNGGKVGSKTISKPKKKVLKRKAR